MRARGFDADNSILGRVAFGHGIGCDEEPGSELHDRRTDRRDAHVQAADRQADEHEGHHDDHQRRHAAGVDADARAAEQILDIFQ